jgi:hypothetical protein
MCNALLKTLACPLCVLLRCLQVHGMLAKGSVLEQAKGAQVSTCTTQHSTAQQLVCGYAHALCM